MKYILQSLVLSSVIIISGCDDTKPETAPQLGTKTYTSSSGLELYYNNQAMPGKTMTLQQEGEKAHIKAFASFNLADIPQADLSGSVPASGVIPGLPELNIDVNLTESNGGWVFSGMDDTEYCTFNYEGYADASSFKFYISEAKLKRPMTSPEIWRPAPLEKNSDGSYKSTPFFIEWEYAPLPDISINLSSFIEALTTLPIIPVYDGTAHISLSQALSETVKAIAFLQDGNVLISYISTLGGAPHIAQTPANSCQYVIDSPATVKLYLNPLSLFSQLMLATSGSTPAEWIDLTATGLYPSDDFKSTDSNPDVNPQKSELAQLLIKNTLKNFMTVLADGIPLCIGTSGDGINLYIDTVMAASLIRSTLLPIITDEKFVSTIEQYIASNPIFESLLPDLRKALQLIPDALEQTNSFKLGFHLIPYDPAY